MSNTQPPKLADQLRAAIRLRGYSYRTEQAYVQWYVRFVRFHKLRHPREMGQPEVAAFLTHLVTDLEVSASTQNQALAALLFLYAEVLKKPLGDVDALHAKKHTMSSLICPPLKSTASSTISAASPIWPLASCMVAACA